MQQALPPAARYSVYLLYWYKSTNTDAAEAWRDGQLPLLPSAVPRALEKLELRKHSGHGRFTSFVGIPLHVTLAVRELLQQQGIQFTGLAGTKVRIPVSRRSPVDGSRGVRELMLRPRESTQLTRFTGTQV